MNSTLALDASNRLQAGVKRSLDVVIGSICLILFGPLLLLIALLIQIETPGQVFYRQKRIGRDGNCFLLFKFRTMHEIPRQGLEQIFEDDPKSKVEYELYQKISDDPRVTWLGRFLRRSSLDELPQLWNVLQGEMSLVGPRPFLPEQLRLYGLAYESYQKMTPGMTGLWQVSGRNDLTFTERVSLDEKYAREWSLWLDVKILLRTPWAVLIQRGAR